MAEGRHRCGYFQQRWNSRSVGSVAAEWQEIHPSHQLPPSASSPHVALLQQQQAGIISMYVCVCVCMYIQMSMCKQREFLTLALAKRSASASAAIDRCMSLGRLTSFLITTSSRLNDTIVVSRASLTRFL